MEETAVHALDYVSVVSRRRWWLALPIVASLVIGLALVRLLPREYRTSTTIGVSAPIVSPNLVNQSTPFDNEERLRALQQQLLSPPILARVVREEGLGTGVPTDIEVSRLRRAIGVTVPEPVAPAMDARRLDTFVISYSAPTASQAQRVANRLATVFVDESSKSRTERAQDTSAFLATQLRASADRLSALGERLRQAKEAHAGQLPEQMAGNFQILGGLRQQLDANTAALRTEQNRLAVLETQITGFAQDGAGPVELSAAAARVQGLQRELAEARAMYTEKHPEVQRLQEELSAATRDAAPVTPAGRSNAQRTAQMQLNPIYRQLTVEREAARLHVRDLQEANRQTQQQIRMYEGRVQAAPSVEQQLGAVQRDYDLERQQYSDLSNKLHASTISADVERNNSGEKFTVLYPAAYPTEPVKPIPLRVMLVALLAGICVGCGLALGREYFDRSIHNVRQLKDEFDVPVLGEVARIQTAS